MEINLGQREYLLEILNYEYVIPNEFHECVKDAIKKYAKLIADILRQQLILKKPQSMASLPKIRGFVQKVS